MRRSVFWGFLALVPLAGFLILLIGDSTLSRIAWSSSQSHSSAIAWILGYWWLPPMVLMSLHQIFFFLHALTNKRLDLVRRLLWALANLIVWPFCCSFVYMVLLERGTSCQSCDGLRCAELR